MSLIFKTNIDMKINKIFFAFVILSGLFLSSCDSFLDPLPEAQMTEKDLIANPVYAEGLLLRAYILLPTTYSFTLDLASDDAVTNKTSSSVNTMVLGGWASNSNPIDQWGKSYESFMYINKFMSISSKVLWERKNHIKDSIFSRRLMGEAYALRAVYGFNLLQSHGGVVGSDLLGYPIVTTVLTNKDNSNLPRNTYAECVKQITDDLDSAIVRLPLKWADITGNTNHNETQGALYTNRINGLTAKLFKSRVLLYAASPAFSASGYTWTQAAEAAAAVMKDNNGLTNITFAKTADLEFYKTYASTEIIWASARLVSKTDLGAANFPPSMFGRGEVNPSQNLVESFPNSDGTPYDTINNSIILQYSFRDPRLAKYIVFNGSTFGGNLMTFADDANNKNAPGRNVNSSLTGYYLKKFVHEGIKIDPGKPLVGQDQFYTYARYTEALLNFAEAANEAVGPTGTIAGYTYTAQAVINAIRTRAGMTSTAYINSLDKDGLRKAIKNERRLELCFEGHRFWDIRRWNDITAMKNAVYGVKFDIDNFTTTVSKIQVRDYKDYQIYGPIPYNETLKYDLKQNNSWQ